MRMLESKFEMIYMSVGIVINAVSYKSVKDTYNAYE